MRLLKYIINDETLMFEANIINAGKDEIIIKDSDGKEVENIHNLDKIVKKYLNSDVFTSRTTAIVKQWFESNFYNWIKKGATDPADDMMDEKKFQQIFYVPLDKYMDELLQHEGQLVKSGKLSKEIILNSFPDYVKNNPTAAVIFSGGRLYRLKRITSTLEQIQDYFLANEQSSGKENDICPLGLQSKNISKISFPEGIKRTIAWHKYVEQQAEKVGAAKALQLVKSLKKGTDYKIIDDSFEDILIVQLKSEKAATVEGSIMKHCITSYGRDIAQGKSLIYSVRNKKMVPVATFEMSKTGKRAVQVKGPHNSTIKPIYHDSIREYFKKNKISVSGDSRNFGGMKES